MARDFVQIRVKGEAEVAAAFFAFDRATRVALSLEIGRAAERIAVRARENAANQGFTPPGRSGRGEGALIREIVAGAEGSTAFVRDDANRDGFPYPAVYEFSRRRARPFLMPAVEEETPQTLADVAVLVQGAAEAAGF